MVPQCEAGVPNEKPDRRPEIVRHDDDDYIDEIRIALVERYKTSELSGDEWRFTAAIRFFRKGVKVWSRGFSNMAIAAASLGWFYNVAREDPEFKPILDEHLCAQPGCNRGWAYEYRLKVGYTKRGEKLDQERWGQFRDRHIRFCAQHKTRGDCGLSDADVNYELVATNEAAVAEYEVEVAGKRCHEVDPRTGVRCELQRGQAHYGLACSAVVSWEAGW